MGLLDSWHIRKRIKEFRITSGIWVCAASCNADHHHRRKALLCTRFFRSTEKGVGCILVYRRSLGHVHDRRGRTGSRLCPITGLLYKGSQGRMLSSTVGDVEQTHLSLIWPFLPTCRIECVRIKQWFGERLLLAKKYMFIMLVGPGGQLVAYRVLHRKTHVAPRHSIGRWQSWIDKLIIWETA